MGIANNTSRSLQIISKQQGWDPNKIDGGGPDLEATYRAHEVFKSDTDPIPADARDAQQDRPDTSASTPPSFHTPVLRENEDHGHADSFSHYKPGAGNQ